MSNALENPVHRAADTPTATGQGRGEESAQRPSQNQPPSEPIYKRRSFIVSVVLLVLIFVGGGIAYWLYSRHFVTTDDAYIDGHVTQISPQVAAPVLVMRITDNQLVHKGDLLIELDPTDYQVALEQAQAQAVASEARLLQAKTQVEASKAAVDEASAQIDAAQVSVDNTGRDLQRYTQVDERARSRQQFDNATAAAKNAQAQLEQSQARKVSAVANVATSQASVKAAEGDLRTAEANLHKAKINLSYCSIYAPSDGRITQRTVEPGAYFQTGQVMFMLVSPRVWVTANFKETQIENMRPGQPVTIRVDAYPSRKFHGHVDSIQAGSGSRFSVLPAENATGNFVKVVQRVPVKIIFDSGDNTSAAWVLGPGFSVIPRVKVQ